MASPNFYSTTQNPNFSAYPEQQVLAVTTTSAAGAFVTSLGINGEDVCIYNNGTSAAQVVFSTTASPTAVNTAAVAAAFATGTQQVFVAPGSYTTWRKGQAAYFAAITDTSTTSLILLAGRGS